MNEKIRDSMGELEATGHVKTHGFGRFSCSHLQNAFPFQFFLPEPHQLFSISFSLKSRQNSDVLQFPQIFSFFCHNGKGNGIFDPDATVTGTEAAKMLLVLAGYEPSKAGLEGTNWATNTLRYAGAAGILDDVSSGLESGLPRQYAAQMIYNALDTNRVKWSTDSESFDDVLNGGIKETVGAAYMGLTKTVATLVSVQKDSLTLANPVVAESDGGRNAALNFTKVSTDYSDLLGQQVKVLYKDGKTNQVLGVTAMADNMTMPRSRWTASPMPLRMTLTATRKSMYM